MYLMRGSVTCVQEMPYNGRYYFVWAKFYVHRLTVCVREYVLVFRDKLRPLILLLLLKINKIEIDPKSL